LALVVCSSVVAALPCCQQQPPTTPAVVVPAKPERALRHVVLFKFKDGISQDTIRAIEAAFKGLKNEIPTIKGFEWGLNNSPEKLDQGFTHCFVATFASEKDRDDYLPNPAHQAFVKKFAAPYVDKVCVVDFWAE
jgi:Stress responsive A/B Barrel Domain